MSTEVRWVSWSTRPDGGNLFRQTKAHALAEGRRTVCQTVVPRGGLPEDPQQVRFARTLADDPSETEEVERCRRCVHLLQLLTG